MAALTELQAEACRYWTGIELLVGRLDAIASQIERTPPGPRRNKLFAEGDQILICLCLARSARPTRLQ